VDQKSKMRLVNSELMYEVQLTQKSLSNQGEICSIWQICPTNLNPLQNLHWEMLCSHYIPDCVNFCKILLAKKGAFYLSVVW